VYVGLIFFWCEPVYQRYKSFLEYLQVVKQFFIITRTFVHGIRGQSWNPNMSMLRKPRKHDSTIARKQDSTTERNGRNKNEFGIKSMFLFSKTNYVFNCQHFKKRCEICFNIMNFINFMNFLNWTQEHISVLITMYTNPDQWKLWKSLYISYQSCYLAISQSCVFLVCMQWKRLFGGDQIFTIRQVN
jgi:hypothetical protein